METKAQISTSRRVRFEFLNNSPPSTKDAFSSIIAQNDEFVAVPTLGCLVEGWVLILPRRHFISTADMPTDMAQRFYSFVDSVETRVQRVYGTCTKFEHGPRETNTNLGCGVDHAHVHLVPLDFPLFPEASQNENLLTNEWRTTHNWQTLGDSLRSRPEHFLAIQDPLDHCHYTYVRSLPSQFLRRLIASRLGLPTKYDYNQYPFLINARRTYARLN